MSLARDAMVLWTDWRPTSCSAANCFRRRREWL